MILIRIALGVTMLAVWLFGGVLITMMAVWVSDAHVREQSGGDAPYRRIRIQPAPHQSNRKRFKGARSRDGYQVILTPQLSEISSVPYRIRAGGWSELNQ